MRTTLIIIAVIIAALFTGLLAWYITSSTGKMSDTEATQGSFSAVKEDDMRASLPSEPVLSPEPSVPSGTEGIQVVHAADQDVFSKFYLIVGSFREESNAENLVRKLSPSRPKAKKLNALSNGLYPVSLDEFDSLESALQHLKNFPELENNYEGVWILNR